MKELNLIDLYDLRRRYIKESYCQEMIDELNETISEKESIFEDAGMTSATGGLGGSYGAGAIGVGMLTPGMGPVSSSQPSAFAGSTIDPAFSQGGGQSGSGDIGVPLNVGPTGVYQKMPAGKPQHGPRGSKRNRREKKLDLKALRGIFAKRDRKAAEPSVPKSGRVMNFDDFAKNQFTKITKLRY